jgi:hypothetical protein
VGEFLIATFSTPWVKVVIVLMACNILSGVAVALFRGVFNLGDLASWLRTRAVPYLLGGATAKLAVQGGGADVGITPGMADVIWGFVILSLLGHIVENLRELGLPLSFQLGAPRSDSLSPPLPPSVPAVVR